VKVHPLLTAAVGLILAGSVAACGSGGSGKSDEKSLTFVNYGGDSLTAATKGWLEPFTKETGIKFRTDSPSDASKVKAMVEAGRTTWDLLDIDVLTGGAGCGTLFEKRSSEVDISAIDKTYITDECGVPVMVQAVGLVYNKKLYGDNPPTKITDFMDTKKFPGKRTIFNYASGGFEPILAADGVPADQIYPLDYERATKAMHRLGGNLVFQSTLAQQGQSLVDGDFGMCMCYLARAAVSKEKGADIGVVWDEITVAWDAIYAVKGSKSPEAQQKFLKFLATAEGQSGFYQYVPYGPTIPDTKLDVKEDWKPFMADFNRDKINAVIPKDVEWARANRDEMFAKWTEATAG
jgi:putative spermidine/putrescine transport system substrate-binding protein